MVRAILWKELREQGLIALTLVVLGGGLLVAAAVIGEPPSLNAAPTDVIRFLGLGRLATLMLAVTAGMVCGGAVFAAEREAATFSFLDSLPASRWQIWYAKLLAGFILALVQIGLLVLLAVALRLVSAIGWATAVVVYSLLAFVWGLFGSTLSRTTLGSVGIAIPAASLTAFFVMIPVTLFFQTPGAQLPRLGGAVLFLACMYLLPLAFSAWLFTSLDRLRASDLVARLSYPVSGTISWVQTAPDAEPISRKPLRGRARFGLPAILWLSGRQIFLPGLVLSVFALLFGIAILLPPMQPFLVWPVFALTAGVVAGVMTFADEQSHGVGRFWSEQRLPTGRVWAVKIGMHLLFCGWLLALLALPSIVHAQFAGLRFQARSHTFLATVFRSPLFDELGPHGWRYLIAPAAYGFAAGHLCGLVFRKLVVACGMAALIGGIGAALWGPSLLSGGLRHWQLWLPALALLFTGLFLLRNWAAERTRSHSGITILASGAAAMLLLLAAGLSYRVLEIPNRPDGESDLAFVASLPPIEKNQGGREFKVAAERYNRLVASLTVTFDPPEVPQNGPRRERMEDQADLVIRTGWKPADPRHSQRLLTFEDWLNRMFLAPPPQSAEAHWSDVAADAARFPIGIYEYPQLLGVTRSVFAPLDSARRMASVLLARGLQQQAAGNPDDFINRFRVATTLSRTLRNGSVVASYVIGLEIERLSLLALDRWLEQLPATSDRPQKMIELVMVLEPTTPFDPAPYFLAERHVLRDAMNAPAQWLPSVVTMPGVSQESSAAEADLVALAWAVPWERERTRRLIGLGLESGLSSTIPSLMRGRPGAELWTRTRSPQDLIDMERAMSAHRRAALLKVALRAYRAREGKYPEALQELERLHLLPRLPDDPFGGERRFGYRLAPSSGEVLIDPRPASAIPAGRSLSEPLPPESVTVPPGQAILWSVGTDQVDQGGKNLPFALLYGPRNPRDLVYLVPVGP